MSSGRMGIYVECPNGHKLKVKDKYAGRKGLCPKCPGEVVISIPDPNAGDFLLDDFSSGLLGDTSLSSKSLSSRYMEAVKEEAARQLAEQAEAASNGPDEGNALDADFAASFATGASASLTGSMKQSARQHKKQCKCGELAPIWFARCGACGEFFPD